MAKPKIRFKGYTDDWEQRKLGEVFKEYSEKGHTELPTLTIIQGGGTVKREDSDRNLMYDETNLSNYKMVRKDDFIVHLRSFEGGLEKASLDGIISPAYHTFHSDEADSRFYYPYFRSFEFIKHKLVPHVYGIRDGRSIDIEGMKSIEIPYTSLSEQRKIGDYLELLDHLITLHQRKNIYFYEKVTLVWEQRKLGDLVGIYDGVHQTPDYQDSGIMFLSVENIATLKSEKYISEEAFERDYNVYPEKGDILMTRIGDVGTTNVVETAEKVAFYVSLALLKPNGIDSYFLSNAMKTNDFQKGLRERTLVTAIPQKINKDEIGKINIFITNNDEEQKKIGAYFSSLDHLITLHQRKCEETKKLKKYMLQKMFPQNGQTVPEIRFAGFTDAWEQRKLGKLVDRVTRKNQDLVSELPLTISAQYGLIDQNEFFDKRVASKDVSGYYLIENGEFAYNKSTSTDAPWGAVKRLDRYENGVLSTLYIVFGIKENNPVDSDFLVSYYSTNLWHKGIHEIAAEGARNHGLLNIAPADFFETELTMPQDIEEQKKIGKYFEELERLITLHQCKCHLLLKLLHNDWEQRKLGEIASSFEYGLNAAAKEYDGENKYIRITDIDDNTHEFLTYNLTSPDIDLTDVENYKLAEGDILFARTGASVGKSYIYRDSDGLVYYAGFLIRARIREEYDAEFVFQSTLTDKYNKYIAVTSQRSGQPGVNAQEYSEFEIRVPEKEEQTKIGTYFHNLDHLITLHQHKCEQLQSMKKFMLQNMFV